MGIVVSLGGPALAAVCWPATIVLSVLGIAGTVFSLLGKNKES